MINSLFHIAEDEDVTIEYCRMPLNKSVSAYDADGNFILMDYELINSPVDEAIHLAHELGHCLTGSFYNPYAKLDIRAKHEQRASRWAYEQLLPYCELQAAVEGGAVEVWQIAEHFNLPDEFAAKAIAYYQERGQMDGRYNRCQKSRTPAEMTGA